MKLPIALAVLVLGLSLILPLAVPAWAEETALSKGNSAYDRGDYAEAARLYWPLAEAGDAEAQAQLGAMYRDGLGLPQDDDQASIWSSYAALQNNATAYYSLGVLYGRRRGMEYGEAEAEALKWYRLAAEQGQADAQVRLGELYEKGQGGLPQDEAEALRWYRLAAEQGHAEGQYLLAFSIGYAEGLTAAEAKAEEVKWYQAAAAQDHAIAQHLLSGRYFDGIGVPADTAEGLRLLQRSAEQGHASASKSLAFQYHNGRRVPKDAVTARMWYRIAEVQGDVSADDSRLELEPSMTAAEIAESEARAQEWLAADPERRDGTRWGWFSGRAANPASGEPPDETALAAIRLAAELGDPNAQFNLGRMHFTGNGLPQDDDAAAHWLSLAAEEGQPRAQAFLGALYIQGRGVQRDMVTAQTWLYIAAAQGDLLGSQVGENNAKELSQAEIAEAEKRARDWLAAFEARLAARLASYQVRGRQAAHADEPAAEAPPSPAEERAADLRRAAEAGDAEAQVRLAGHYMEGLGVPQDDVEAAKWYLAAAEQGNALAQYNTASFMFQGRGVPEDKVAAMAWLRAAAEQAMPEAQHSLGEIYKRGYGAPQDDTEAVGWFRKAAEQDYADAQFSLGEMYQDGRGVPQDHLMAHVWFNLAGAGHQWLRKVAEPLSRGQITEAQAQARALWEAFEARRNWQAVQAAASGAVEEEAYEPDQEAELQAIRQAARAGDADAQLALGGLYEHGKKVPRNYAQAARWYYQAAVQGNGAALFRLGHLFEFGNGVEQSARQAARWYRRAAEHGHRKAFHQLATRYHEGRGLPQDRVLAHTWYSLAVDEGDESAENLRKWLAREMTAPEIAEAEERAEAWRKKFAGQQDEAE